MNCDVCGRELKEHYDVEIEGSRMRVCNGCSRCGKVIKEWKPPVRTTHAPNSQRFQRRPRPAPPEDVLLSGYGDIIKKAREKRSLTREEFGLMINERESIIKQIEQETMRPRDSVLAKIEDALKLSLKVKLENVIKTETHETNTLTLGDVVRIKKKQ